MDQDLFLDVLGSTATKREAKAYLSRFGPNKTALQASNTSSTNTKKLEVNLGNLYGSSRAVDERSVFSHTPDQPNFVDEPVDVLRVALIKIRAPQSIQDETLPCIGHTLSQLSKLGLSCVVVVDVEDEQERTDSENYESAIKQADRLVEAIDIHAGQGARTLDNVIGVSSVNERLLPSVKVHSEVHIMQKSLLLAPLRRGITPVIAPVGFVLDTQRRIPVIGDEVILALTREFAGIQIDALAEDDDQQILDKITSLQKQISVDRIILLDPLGGIPSTDRIHGSHVFINLEQEFDAIKYGILGNNSTSIELTKSPGSFSSANNTSGASARSSQISKFSGSEVESSRQTCEATTVVGSQQMRVNFHVRNLELLNNALALLPPTSSAFLTTPDAVANSQSRPPVASQGPRVRTRRQRNPLIHNLLTDKPAFSSSLPSHRSPNPAARTSMPVKTSSPATFFKRGMPVSIVPNPVEHAWGPPSDVNPSIDFADPRIDLPRLVHLIDDSFNRTLDVPRYLARVKDRIAGVITAGEYEGGAILTWETPHGFSPSDPQHMVPYLDKFAVLKRSQGAGGVADIVFKAMVRDCFPNGVCWRSRANNPVNKWYFERAKGTWKMPGTNWTMFWTTEGVERGDDVFLDYEAVCKAVLPTWADQNIVVD